MQDKIKFEREPNYTTAYSRKLPIITGIIFIFCIVVGLTKDCTNALDTSVSVTAITVSGGIFGSTLIYFLKKAQSENTFILKMKLYKCASEERYNFNSRMMELKAKYNMSDDDVQEIENNSSLDEFTDEALESVENSVNEAMNEATETVELKSF